MPCVNSSCFLISSSLSVVFPCFLLICLAAVECNKNHIGRDTLLDSSMKLPRCLTLSTAILEQTLKITSHLYPLQNRVSWKEVGTKTIISALKAPSLMLLKKSLDLSCGYPCWLLNEGSRSLTRSLLPFLVSTSVTNSMWGGSLSFSFFCPAEMEIGQLVTFCLAFWFSGCKIITQSPPYYRTNDFSEVNDRV